MKRNLIKVLGLVILLSLALSACATETTSGLTATGYLSAQEASIAPELSGRVVAVEVSEGQVVTMDQVLFRIDDEFSLAQRDQAAAAVQQAEAGVKAARMQAASAQAQYELTLQGARMQTLQARQLAWSATNPENFRPAWYYQKGELVAAAEAQATAADEDLQAALTDLDAELKKASSQDFMAAEARLAEAQLAFSSAQQTQAQALLVNNDQLTAAAEDILNAAQTELDAALLDYERMLSTSAAEALLEARARVAVAQVNLDNTRDALSGLQTGEESLAVVAARAAAQAAESMIAQAEAGLLQAQQALALAELQLERSVTKSPIDGVLLTRNLEVGEIAVAGGTVMRVAKLDMLELIVYLPEDQYGRVMLDDVVSLTVDSYVGQTFSGRIIHISDEAEFTPRNVQTEQGRKATVYAVKIRVENPEHLLKPGMPADVDFNLHQ